MEKGVVMRLSILDDGHTVEQKEKFRQIEARGGRPGDMSKVCAYRPEFFGAVFSSLTNTALHEPSQDWTQGERELFAAFVSRLNHCQY